MSDSAQVVKGSGTGLDLSVTEVLELLGKLNKISAPPKAPTGWVYANELKKAQPQFDDARKVVTGYPAAAKFVLRMEGALRKVDDANGKKKPEDAKKYLARAVGETQKIAAAAKKDFGDRKAVIEGPLAGVEGRINGLAAAPQPVAQALQAAKTAQTNAMPAADDQLGDWGTAFTALNTFKLAMDAIGPAWVAEAQTKAQAFDLRYNPVKDTKPCGKDFAQKLVAYSAARRTFDAAITGKDGLTALESASATDVALTNFIGAAAPSAQVKQQRVTAAMTTLTSLKDKDLANKTLLEKAEIALDLCAEGVSPDKDQIEQLVRIYNNSKPDQQFMSKRGQQREEIADDVLAIPELTAVFDKKGKPDSKAWKALVAATNKMLGMLTKTCDTQCDTLGMPHIRVFQGRVPAKGRTKGTLNFGGCDPSSNSIGLNLHPDCFKTVKDGLDTIVHETFHAHQDFVVKRLRSGDIKPTDPDYATAMMWMVNDIGVGYVLDQVSSKDYERQPTEFDSFYNADETIKSLVIKSKQNAKGN